MRWNIRFLLVGCLWLISATAYASLQPDDKFNRGEGAVVFTVTVDYPSSANVNAIAPLLLPTVTVQSVDGDKPRLYFLNYRLEGLQSVRAYGGSLPPGRYRFYDFAGHSCALTLVCRGPTIPAPAEMPEFTVSEGQISYLGTISFAAIVKSDVTNLKDMEQRWAWSNSPDLVSGRRLISAMYHELAEQTDKIVAGWSSTPDKFAATRKLQAEMRFRSSGYYQASSFGQDGFYFGAQNGVIKRWSPLDGLKLIDTGSDFPIRTVAAQNDGRILAGGEGTTLLYSPDGGRTWQDAAVGLPFGIITKIVRINDEEVVFSLLQKETASLYRGHFGASTWTKLGEFQAHFAFWTGFPGALPELFVQGQDLVMSLPSKQGVHLRLDGGQPRVFALPGGIQSFSYTLDGVMRCRCARSIAVNPFESRDMGRTWQPADLDRYLLLPVFKSSLEGFSYQGALFSKTKSGVVVTQDGGKAWEKVSGMGNGNWWAPTYSADGSRMLLTGVLMLTNSAMDMVQTSADGGKTWSLLDGPREWLYPPISTPISSLSE